MSADRNAGDGGAEGAIGLLLAAVVAAVYLGFNAGAFVSAPPVKSDRELCEDRGGVYVDQHHRRDLCLAKEAFK